MGKQLTIALLSASVIAVTAGCAQNKQKTASSIQSPQWKQGYELPEPNNQGDKPLDEPKILPQTHYAAAQLLEAKGMIDDAITQYKKAIAVNHNYGEAYQALAILYAQTGRNDEAIQAMTKAVDICPSDPLARNNLGYLLMRHNRWAEAKRQLVQATKLQPYFARAHINLGMCLSKLGRFDEAYESFRTVLPQADAKYNLGLMFRGQQRYEEAAQTFREVLAANPEFAAAANQLADLQPYIAPDEDIQSEKSSPQFANEADDSGSDSNAYDQDAGGNDGKSPRQPGMSETSDNRKTGSNERTPDSNTSASARSGNSANSDDSCPADEFELQACMSYDIAWCEEEGQRQAGLGVMRQFNDNAGNSWQNSALRNFADRQNTMKAQNSRNPSMQNPNTVSPNKVNPKTMGNGPADTSRQFADGMDAESSQADWFAMSADFDYDNVACHEQLLADMLDETSINERQTAVALADDARTTSGMDRDYMDRDNMIWQETADGSGGVDGLAINDDCEGMSNPFDTFVEGGVTYDMPIADESTMGEFAYANDADASTLAAIIDQVNLIDHAGMLHSSRQTMAMNAIPESRGNSQGMVHGESHYTSGNKVSGFNGYAAIHHPAPQNAAVALRDSIAEMSMKEIEYRLVQVRDEIDCLDNDLATLYGPYRHNVSVSDLALDYVPGMDWTVITVSPMEQATYQALRNAKQSSGPEEVPVQRSRETMSMTVTDTQEDDESTDCDKGGPQGNAGKRPSVPFDNLLTLMGLVADGNSCWDVAKVQQFLTNSEFATEHASQPTHAERKHNRASTATHSTYGNRHGNAGKSDKQDTTDAPVHKASTRDNNDSNNESGLGGDDQRSQVEEDRHWIHRTSNRRRAESDDDAGRARRPRTARYRLGHRGPDRIIRPE